jgi:hypothetical protein
LIRGDSILTVGGLEIPGKFTTMNTVSWIDLNSGQSWVGPKPLLPITSQCAILLNQNEGCTEQSTIYLFGGHDSLQQSTSFCEKLKFDFSSSDPKTASSHLNSISTFFGMVAPLQMAVDVSSNVALDSLWPFIQTLSASYSWDSSIVVFEGYHPPVGWSLVSLDVGAKSASYTIRKIGALFSSPFNIGRADFVTQDSKGSSLISLDNLSIKHGTDQLTFCLAHDEGHYWMVFVLGEADVENYVTESFTHWQLFDLLGRLLDTGASDFNEQDFTRTLSSGAYLLRLTSKHSVQTKRIVFIK